MNENLKLSRNLVVKGAVTIATNMAGRGTDILLGGNAEFMARLRVREALLPKIVKPEDGDLAFEKKGNLGKAKENKWKVKDGLYPCDISTEASTALSERGRKAIASWGERSLDVLEAEDRLSFACEKGPTEDEGFLAIRDAFTKIEAEFETYTKKKDEVLQLGGLHVVGTERHESRRVDNQLRGRSGRQGDPGSTRYFLSLEDNLFRIFGGDKIQNMMSMFRVEDMPIESSMLTASLDSAQTKVETYFYDIRKQLFDYDQVLNFATRKSVL